MDQLIRVFIADASRDCVELLQALLTREDDLSVVGVAYRGDDALRAFPESGADLLLCDIMLPGLDGLSLLRELKSSGALPHAIILSAFYNNATARSASYLADTYLPKPCGAEELLRYIRETVRGTEHSFVRSVREEVRRALLEARVMPHLDGFRYLKSALEHTRCNPALLHGVTKSLYRDVAKEFDTTAACVERSIRAAIDRAWTSADSETRMRIFGPQLAQQARAPSNVPFLTAMTAYIESRVKTSG